MADFLGKYELRNVLGKGAMGTVYEGFDPIIARQVAIKTVRLPDAEDHEAQEELARFKREAQAAGRLSHPNIVGVFDYGETPELAYIVMEYVNGTTLKHVVDKKERFELNEIVRIMESLMAGLQYSHDRGVVHRDIKPANVMLTKSGEVKIADFGIARIESSSMTQAGTMLGTPSYMSPEQFMGQTVDARTDLYSSGVMLYQLLTGEKPFEGGLTAIMHKVLNTEPPPPSALSVTVPHSFDMVVQKAMAKRPEDRFASANDFAKAVRDAFEGRGASPDSGFGFGELGDGDATMVTTARPAAKTVTAPAASTARPVTSVPEKKGAPVGLIVGAVVVLLLLGGGAYFLLGGKNSSPAPVAQTTPAPVQKPVTPPAPPQLTAAQKQADITSALSYLSCTFFAASFQGGQAVITGLAGAGAPQAAYSAALGALPAGVTVIDQTQTFDGPYCDELNTMRSYHPLFGGPDRLVLGLQGGQTTLHDGDLITIDQSLPSFTKYVETDYFSNDGSVTHLTPKLKPGQTTLVQPLGNVSAPYGTDMIISIASSAPLFSAPRTQVESASDYLPPLRAAMQNIVSAGAQVSVDAIQVNTLPKAGQ
jgi:serine/threonine-protein kinase